jgi:hypothetical protein
MRKFDDSSVLRHEKGKQGIKGPRHKKFMPEDEVGTIGPSGLGFRTIQFFQNI